MRVKCLSIKQIKTNRELRNAATFTSVSTNITTGWQGRRPLCHQTPAKSVPPTPGTALQNKIQKNLEKSLGDSLNIHLQQQMGSFQASMLEAFQSLREELATKKKVEVESSLPASKPGSSSNNAAHLDLPPPRSGTNPQSEAMDVDYGPALPPRLVLNQDTSDQYVAPSEGHPEEVSYSHKKQSHKQPVDPSSASDQLREDSDHPQIPSSRPKKHSDKSKHKSRSRCVIFFRGRSVPCSQTQVFKAL